MARRRGGRQSYSPCRQPKKPQSHRQDGQVSTGLFGELVKEMNESTKKCNKERQKLQDNHRSRVQKVEAGILDLVHAKRLHFIKYRAAQMKRLFELVRKRADIENHILSRVQSLGDVYSSASHSVQALLQARLSKLS